MTAPCPGCGADVLTMPDGRHLDTRKSLVGRWLPDGYELTPNQQRDPGLRGHHLHTCPPNATASATPAPTQDALF